MSNNKLIAQGFFRWQSSSQRDRRVVARLLVLLLWLALIVMLAGQGESQGGSEPPDQGPYGGPSPYGDFVGDETCAACHDDMTLPATQIHARIEPFEVRGHVVGCEGCHGPGEGHVDDGDGQLIGIFGAGGLGDAACMDCHQRKGLPEWHASTHAVEEVGCADCHTIHTLTVAQDSCQTCHGDVLAAFQLPSRHPLTAGKMTCADCHDVHNAAEGMLKTALRPNDLCFECHQDKEGPFIFEHEPVQEDCQTCHVPHGSVANNLLTANEPTLCLQCHEPHFHSGYRGSDDFEVDVGGFERENPFGAQGMNIAFTTSCTQCHSQVHGSDLPSQTVPGRGRGLSP